MFASKIVLLPKCGYREKNKAERGCLKKSTSLVIHCHDALYSVELNYLFYMHTLTLSKFVFFYR